MIPEQEYIRKVTKMTKKEKAPVYAPFSDITERKRVEDQLRVSEERYRSLTDDVLDSSGVVIIILDL